MEARSKVQLTEVEPLIQSLIEKVSTLETKVEELESYQKPALAAWVTLRQAAEYSGLSYHSIRRPENASKRPAGGVKIRGVMRYPKREVVRWCEEMGR